MAKGDQFVDKYDLSTLKVIGSVAEPSTKKPGIGTMKKSGKAMLRLWILGGKPRPAEL
ncbi:hypothetical protein [Okeania hirsuta]|uniref:hypothetical protein n=1 Tax=Okeania hirsuta TaxID=1458930 RepID=UPI001EFFED90|nr:hypothetical protein [Okeania hirsuta]